MCFVKADVAYGLVREHELQCQNRVCHQGSAETNVCLYAHTYIYTYILYICILYICTVYIYTFFTLLIYNTTLYIYISMNLSCAPSQSCVLPTTFVQARRRKLYECLFSDHQDRPPLPHQTLQKSIGIFCQRHVLLLIAQPDTRFLYDSLSLRNNDFFGYFERYM